MPTNSTVSRVNVKLSLDTEIISRENIQICVIQHFEADFLWKVSPKILNSGIILKTFTHVFSPFVCGVNITV